MNGQLALQLEMLELTDSSSTSRSRLPASGRVPKKSARRANSDVDARLFPNQMHSIDTATCIKALYRARAVPQFAVNVDQQFGIDA